MTIHIGGFWLGVVCTVVAALVLMYVVPLVVLFCVTDGGYFLAKRIKRVFRVGRRRRA